MKNTEKGIFQVQMLGGFSMSYEGREVVLSRNSTARFIQLLQLVWLQGERGISREQLLQYLYDRENLSNASNSLNNLLYQLRRQMVENGFPKEEYITKQGGVYRMDSKLRVKIDALEFKRLVSLGDKAVKEGAEDQAYGYYNQAFMNFGGLLLPAISTELWVMNEAMTLKKGFEQTVNWMGQFLKQRKDYSSAYRVYARAAEIYPFDDWQTGQIDILICQGKTKEAYTLYDRTVKRYSEEMGLPPSTRLLKCYEEMGSMLTGNANQLEDIMQEMKEGAIESIFKKPDSDREEGNGAYFCSYPAFVDVYHLLKRTLKRTSSPVSLMLCTLVDYEGKMIQNPEKLRARSDALNQAIRQSLRQGDAYTRYSLSQYLILLVGSSQENSHIVGRRLIKKLKALAGSRAEMEYSMLSLDEEL